MKTKGNILLVEDNHQLSDTNRRYLQLAGLDVTTAYTLAQAREQLALQDPDVILLDVMLPDGDGIDFCREIFNKTEAQIIFLTAKAEEEDQVRGLLSGGNVYLTKPYSLKVMLSYVEASIRQKNAHTDKIPDLLKLGDLELNLLTASGLWKGQDLMLAQKEFAILLILAQNHGKLVSAQSLFESIWKLPSGSDKNTLWTHISRLKHKLSGIAGDGAELDSVRGEGYILTIFGVG
jgi:DNA-binding response OmpR family regulator